MLPQHLLVLRQLLYMYLYCYSVILKFAISNTGFSIKFLNIIVDVYPISLFKVLVMFMIHQVFFSIVFHQMLYRSLQHCLYYQFKYIIIMNKSYIVFDLLFLVSTVRIFSIFYILFTHMDILPPSFSAVLMLLFYILLFDFGMCYGCI